MRPVTHMITMYILINKITDDSKQNNRYTSYTPDHFVYPD